MEQLPGVEAKIQEYVNRILNGEDPDDVFQGGNSFRRPVEERLKQLQHEKDTDKIVHESDTESTVGISPAAVAERLQQDHEEIERIKGEIDTLSAVHHEQLTPDEIDKRKKLSGWSASYELARIAKTEGIDLSILSREAYARYAIDNYLAIDDGQLRAQPWQRNETSVEDIVLKGKEQRNAITEETEKRFARFSFEMTELAKKNQSERYIRDNIRILSGTKDSNSWLFFSINNGTNQSESDTYKSYFSLHDLNQFSPEQFVSFMEILQSKGYSGGVKIFQDLTEQGTRLNDQIVMHGFSKADAEHALDIAKDFFGNNIADTSVGKDEIVDGESKSYSQLLAEKIQQEINTK